MRYLLENDYTQRLYAQIGAACPDLTLLKHDKISGIGEDDTLVLDENDWVHYMASGKTPKEVIVFGENSPLYGTHRTISKYQPAKKIQSALQRARHPILLVTSDANVPHIESILSVISRVVEVEYTVSTNYPPQKPFDLFSFLVALPSKELLKNRLDVCQTLKDYLKPPISDITSMLFSLSEQGRTMVLSTPLKGALDLAIMELCDAVIFLKVNKAPEFITSLTTIKPSLHFKVIDISNSPDLLQLEDSIKHIFGS